MHYLKAENINLDNICYIWKTRPKLQIVQRNIFFSISNKNFICSNPFCILKIHSHHQELWKWPGQPLFLVPWFVLSARVLLHQSTKIRSVYRAGERSEQVEKIDTALPGEIEFRVKQIRSWCAGVRGSQTWMVSKGSWFSVTCGRLQGEKINPPENDRCLSWEAERREHLNQWVAKNVSYVLIYIGE